VKIKLEAWAAQRYDPPPSAWVLRKWVRDGEISPMPERVGNHYYVEHTARRITAPVSLVERIKERA
jgi:predicted site-specific integrase-resolvase